MPLVCLHSRFAMLRFVLLFHLPVWGSSAVRFLGHPTPLRIISYPSMKGVRLTFAAVLVGVVLMVINMGPIAEVGTSDDMVPLIVVAPGSPPVLTTPNASFATNDLDEEVGDAENAKMVKGQLEDENKVEAILPPLGIVPSVSLSTTAKQIFNDDATMNIPLTIGVLTVPGLLRSRLIPLLESSLKHETDIHVFFMDTPKSVPGQEVLRDYLRQVNRTHHVHIVPLPPPKNMKMSLRNAWVNLPAIKYFRVARPQQKWFAIMDDDTYFLMNAVRRLLRDAETNHTNDDRPVYMGAPITDGLRGGCRLVRSGKTKRAFHTTGRKEVVFVCGGSGILLNRLTMDELFKLRNESSTGAPEVLYDYCVDTMFQGAGDVRLGHCLSEANVSIIARREMFRDTMFRAIGEKRQYDKYEFPASFHRFRRREWQYALRAVEDARARNELVTWADLLHNFVPGSVYYHSMFYPTKYDNYTDIMGLKRKTPYQVRREITLQKKYHCGRKPNTDLW